jgi:hypothetical protein
MSEYEEDSSSPSGDERDEDEGEQQGEETTGSDSEDDMPLASVSPKAQTLQTAKTSNTRTKGSTQRNVAAFQRPTRTTGVATRSISAQQSLQKSKQRQLDDHEEPVETEHRLTLKSSLSRNAGKHGLVGTGASAPGFPRQARQCSVGGKAYKVIINQEVDHGWCSGCTLGLRNPYSKVSTLSAADIRLIIGWIDSAYSGFIAAASSWVVPDTALRLRFPIDIVHVDLNSPTAARELGSALQRWSGSEQPSGTIVVCYGIVGSEYFFTIIRMQRGNSRLPPVSMAVQEIAPQEAVRLFDTAWSSVNKNHDEVRSVIPAWSSQKEGILVMVTVVEEMIRVAWQDVWVDMKPTLLRRLKHIIVKECVHSQDETRVVENKAVLGEEFADRPIAWMYDQGERPQPFTNVLGITYVDHHDKATVIFGKEKLQWHSGERHENGQQWWHTGKGDKVVLLQASTEDECIQSLAKASDFLLQYRELSVQADEHRSSHKRKVPFLTAARKTRDKVLEVLPPISVEDMFRDLALASSSLGQWDWKNPSASPLPAPDRPTLNQFMESTGFAVFVYADGSELVEFAADMEEQWRTGTKFNVDNEVQVATSFAEKGKGRTKSKTKHIWFTVAKDLGRLEVWLQETPSLIATVVREYFPAQNQEELDIKYPSLMGTHRAAAAQHLHWDMQPLCTRSDLLMVLQLLGSYLAAIKPARVIVCPFSHQGQSKTGKSRFRPGIAVYPAGSVLLFSNLAHAGYGVWPVDEALIRPVPSADDLAATDCSEWSLRIQGHIGRSNCSSADVLHIVESYREYLPSMKRFAAHIYLNRDEDLPYFYPPVFLPESKVGAAPVTLDYGAFAPHCIDQHTIMVRKLASEEAKDAPAVSSRSSVVSSSRSSSSSSSSSSSGSSGHVQVTPGGVTPMDTSLDQKDDVSRGHLLQPVPQQAAIAQQGLSRRRVQQSDIKLPSKRAKVTAVSYVGAVEIVSIQYQPDERRAALRRISDLPSWMDWIRSLIPSFADIDWEANLVALVEEHGFPTKKLAKNLYISLPFVGQVPEEFVFIGAFKLTTVIRSQLYSIVQMSRVEGTTVCALVCTVEDDPTTGAQSVARAVVLISAHGVFVATPYGSAQHSELATMIELAAAGRLIDFHLRVIIAWRVQHVWPISESDRCTRILIIKQEVEGSEDDDVDEKSQEVVQGDERRASTKAHALR